MFTISPHAVLSLLGLAQLHLSMDYLQQVTWHLQSEPNSKHSWNDSCFRSVVDVVRAKCKCCWVFGIRTRYQANMICVCVWVFLSVRVCVCVYSASRPSCRPINHCRGKIQMIPWNERKNITTVFSVHLSRTAKGNEQIQMLTECSNGVVEDPRISSRTCLMSAGICTVCGFWKRALNPNQMTRRKIKVFINGDDCNIIHN